jgi:hypothetical protein
VGLIIGNRGLQGGPMLPYPDQSQYSGNDAFIPLVFLDRNRVPVVPTSIIVELDDLTNCVTMDGGPNTLVSTGASGTFYTYPAFASGSPTPWLLQAEAAVMQMTYPYEGSQICQLKVVWTGIDSVTSNTFTDVITWIIELVSAPTVSGAL